MNTQKYTTFSVLVENKFWVLTRVARLFSRHMFNIHSLTVAPTLDAHVSCMTIDVEESEYRLKRIELELKKIVNVLAVHICHPSSHVQSEMILVKINKANPKFRNFVTQAERFQSRILYRHDDCEIYEFSGDQTRVAQFIELSLSHQAEAIVRTGSLAMPKQGKLTDI